MNCLTENMLRAYHDGELTGASRAEAEIHLSACDRCREQLERVSEMARRVQGRLKSLDTSDSGMDVEPHDALARFQAPRGDAEEHTQTFARSFARRWGPAWPAGALAAILLDSLAFPCGR